MYKGLSCIHTLQRSAVVFYGEVLADIFPDHSVLGGAPFNVARHLKAFGGNPILISRLGHDELSEEVLRAMLQNGMDTVGIQRDNSHPTGQVKVHMEDGTHRFEILPTQAYDFINPATARMNVLSSHPVLIYFGTLAQRNLTSKDALSSLLGSTDAVRFLDINLRPPWYDEKILRQSLGYADILKLNIDELEVMVKMFGLSAGAVQDSALQLIALFDLEQVLITCGDKGALLICKDGKVIESYLKGSAFNFVDSVGAGDGFSTICILGALHGWTMHSILERANAFAAAICGIRGAIPENEKFYMPFTKEWGI